MPIVIPIIIAALRRVQHERFFANEQGFRGQFQTNLQVAGALPPDAIAEEEHQKTLTRHRITRRPDLTIHIPTPVGGNVRVGNFAVFEFKREGSAADAREDFLALDEIVGALDYALAVFVNVGDRRTHADQYNGRFADRLHFFAVWREQNATRVRHSRLVAGAVVTDDAAAN